MIVENSSCTMNLFDKMAVQYDFILFINIYVTNLNMVEPSAPPPHHQVTMCRHHVSRLHRMQGYAMHTIRPCRRKMLLVPAIGFGVRISLVLSYVGNLFWVSKIPSEIGDGELGRLVLAVSFPNHILEKYEK